MEIYAKVSLEWIVDRFGWLIMNFNHNNNNNSNYGVYTFDVIERY